MMHFPRYSTLAWVNGVLGLLSAALCVVIALPKDAACPATGLGSILHGYIACPVVGWELLVAAVAAFVLAAACVRWMLPER